MDSFYMFVEKHADGKKSVWITDFLGVSLSFHCIFPKLFEGPSQAASIQDWHTRRKPVLLSFATAWCQVAGSPWAVGVASRRPENQSGCVGPGWLSMLWLPSLARPLDVGSSVTFREPCHERGDLYRTALYWTQPL